MPAGLGLRLGLGLRHHGRAEGVGHGRLAGPRRGLRDVGWGPRGGARAARVEGGRAAVETGPAAPSAPNAAVAQVHGQSLLRRERIYRFILRNIKPQTTHT